jgi:hypothetical protein
MMQAEVSKYTDWDAHIIQAIARAENGTCDPTRHNETASETHRDANGDVVCVGSYGALQVGCIHYLPTEDRSDLATNIRVAHRAWTSREAWGVGYEAWTMYLNGRYKENL